MKQHKVTIVLVVSIILSLNIFAYSRRSGYGSSPAAYERRVETRLKKIEDRLANLEDARTKIMNILERQGEAIRLLILPPELRDAGPLKEPLRSGQHVFFTETDRLKVVQIVDSSNMMIELSSWLRQPNIWMTGISTTDMADDKAFTLSRDRIFRVVGTRSYTTIRGGQRTVFELKLVH